MICEKCGKPMVIKWGKHGSFLACTGYPDCTNTRQLHVGLHELGNGDGKIELTEQDADEYCENCGRAMVLKKGRFGTFFACTRLSGLQDDQTDWRHAEEGGRPAGRRLPEVRQQAGDEVRAVRRVHGLQQLSEVQVRQAEDHRRRLPELHRRARSRSGARSAARRSTGAIGIRNATSWRGRSRSMRSVRNAVRPTWSRST